MRCTVCDSSFQPSLISNKSAKEIAYEMKVCATCQRRIIECRPKGYQKGRKHHTKCSICGRDVDHHGLTPTCMTGSCRGKWYRMQKEIEDVKEAIKNNDYDRIRGFSISKIRELGFDVRLTEPLQIDVVTHEQQKERPDEH